MRAESLLAFIINPDHRLMVINNIGKSGGLARVLKFVTRLRIGKIHDESEVVHDFARTLISPARSRHRPPSRPWRRFQDCCRTRHGKNWCCAASWLPTG